MVRKEGFIDLDKALKDKGVDTTSIETMIESRFVQSMYDLRESNLLLKLSHDIEIVYFKYSKFCLPYSELVANELARDFGLPVVEYDLAILGNCKGVLSKNFRKNSAYYTSGEELLLDFGYDFDDKSSHSLEKIWDSLEYRYRNHPNKRKIVKKLMNRVVSIFIFDIIICQNDRHSANWEIEEFWDSTDVDIAPIYDNEKMLSTNGTSAFLSMIMDDDKNLVNNLQSFQKVSSERFSDLINDKIWIISDKNLESVFERVEEKTGYPMPLDVKQYYLKEFHWHRKQLEKVIFSEKSISKQMR